jgi:flagellar basal-body rod protein FlgB
MPWEGMNEEAIRLLERSLNWQSRRHDVIAANLANLDTPRYTSKELDFRDVLSGYLSGRPEVQLITTNAQHLGKAAGPAGQVKDTGKAVDLDQEIVQMSENQISYQASVQMLIKKLDFLKNAVEGGK